MLWCVHTRKQALAGEANLSWKAKDLGKIQGQADWERVEGEKPVEVGGQPSDHHHSSLGCFGPWSFCFFSQWLDWKTEVP